MSMKLSAQRPQGCVGLMLHESPCSCSDKNTGHYLQKSMIVHDYVL